MSGKDFEPIGKRKKTRPTKKPANSRRRQRRDDYDESPFDDEQFNEHTEYQQEDELMAKKSKKGVRISKKVNGVGFGYWSKSPWLLRC